MSVWESTTYKIDMAREIYSTFPSQISSILGDTIGCYLSPRGEMIDFEADDVWESLAGDLDWELGYEEQQMKADYQELTQFVTQWSCGVGAVYKLIDAAYYDKFEVKDQYNYSFVDRFVNTLGSVVASPSLISADAFYTKWMQQDKKLIERSRVMENFAEAWKYFARSTSKWTDELTDIDQEYFFGDGDRCYYGKFVNKLIIMVGSGHYRNRGLIFTRTHLNILIEASQRIANLINHVAKEYSLNFLCKKRIMGMLELTIRCASTSKGKNTDKVVQAFHKARAYMQMVMFDNVMENSLEEAIKEYKKKGLGDLLLLSDYEYLFTEVPKGRWLELFHVYKWMPPPDFDSTYTFQDIYEYHMAPRKSGLDSDASDEMKDTWKLIEKERKLNVAVTYKSIYHEWPSGLVIKNDNPTEESLDDWVPENLFPYHVYGSDVTTQIKDKTTVFSKIDDEISGNGKKYEQNFLTWFLLNKEFIDTRDFAADFEAGCLHEDTYVRVAYKGEAHKPGSRLFYMAPPRQRILLGELEGNLSRIAAHYPASLQGMDAIRRAEKLANLFDINDETFISGVTEEYTLFVTTFDLAKFSPQFNGNVLENLHEFWAKIFGYKPIEAMYKIGGRSVILHTTNGIIMQYKNIGADLEGFRGRMMTLFHADLISAACRKAIKQGFIVGKAITAVFIDDGAVRIAAKGSGDVAKRNALRFLRCMQDVYAAAGQENHPNKTIVSRCGGELLAEQYLYGQRLKCPIKAAMRVYPSYENPANSITEEFDAFFATIQGAVKDGADWVIAYRLLAEAYIKAVCRWERKFTHKADCVQLALKFITPKSIGGFGFPSLMSLCSTTSYDSTGEGFGMLNYVGNAIPEYQPMITKILDRPVIRRDPLQILRDPGRVRMEGRVLVEGRALAEILKKLLSTDGPWSRYLVNFRDDELTEHARAVAKALLKSESVSLPVLKRAWDSTPLAYVEGLVQKFKKAGSITSLLSEKEINSIRRKNRADVSSLVKTFF